MVRVLYQFQLKQSMVQFGSGHTILSPSVHSMYVTVHTSAKVSNY